MDKRIFEKKYFKQITQITWWEKILLLFCKPYYSSDFGFDMPVILRFKKLFGKIYIMEELKGIK